MKLKKPDQSIAYFGFITGLAVGIAASVLLTRTKCNTIKEEQTSKQTDFIKTNEIADHLAYLGHQAELGL